MNYFKRTRWKWIKFIGGFLVCHVYGQSAPNRHWLSCYEDDWVVFFSLVEKLIWFDLATCNPLPWFFCDIKFDTLSFTGGRIGPGAHIRCSIPWYVKRDDTIPHNVDTVFFYRQHDCHSSLLMPKHLLQFNSPFNTVGDLIWWSNRLCCVPDHPKLYAHNKVQTMCVGLEYSCLTLDHLMCPVYIWFRSDVKVNPSGHDCPLALDIILKICAWPNWILMAFITGCYSDTKLHWSVCLNLLPVTRWKLHQSGPK